jgi:cAMP-dependent protein kinase regulator
MKRKHVDAFNPKENSRKNGKNNDGKPVPTAQDLRQYLAKNSVEPLFVSIMECLCIDRPKNVPAYIIQYLQNNFSQDTENVRSPKQSTPTTSMPESWSTFRFGSSNDMDETSDEIAAVNSYRMQKRSDNDDNEDPPVSDVVSENIRRRYSIGGRRVGLSNEPLDETLSSPVVVQKSAEDLKHIELALTQCTMLSHLDSDDKSTISSAMFPKHCEKDQLIIQQGDEGSHFYVIDSGECEVFVNGEFYKTLEVCFLF